MKLSHGSFIIDKNKIKQMKNVITLWFVTLIGFGSPLFAQQLAHNPLIFADVPDLSMVRVGDTYYMSSTTMHMSPGLPIMKSRDLSNWHLVSYAYDTLANNVDDLNLANGKSTYGKGTWASSIRHHKGTFYVSTFAQTTGKTYIYSTKNIEKGPWKVRSFGPSFHDHSLFFDDDGKAYLIYGAGKIKMVTLKPDLSGVDTGIPERVIIENASLPSGTEIGLPAEGSQLFKIKGKYYLFNITWPRGGMRTVVIHRADKITGPYEGKVGLQDIGVAQGGLIDMPNGEWYAYLFRDFGAVGRIPYLVPVKWQDGWPVLGNDGKVPETLNLPQNSSLIPGIVASDEFDRKPGEADLPLVWQWNHQPEAKLWSVKRRAGYLRLKTGRIDTNFLLARNTLTQRTIGPFSAGSTAIDISNLKDGDFAGLGILQKNYGSIGVERVGNDNYIVMIDAGTGRPEKGQRIKVSQKRVYFKIECDFALRRDVANFYYSLDGKVWQALGHPLKMSYTIPHFMGYRFALFNYAQKQIGGYADFDYFHISSQKEDKLSHVPLKDAFKNKFYVGVALNARHISGRDTAALNIVKSQFNSIVAENSMKSMFLQPVEGQFQFNEADKFVDFGTKNNMFMIGHTLIWHSQTPKWFFVDSAGKDVSREVLINRMKNHITTVVSRYKGRIKGWDVVNEAILDDGSFRKSKFYNIIGEDFIRLAFEFAQAADPSAELYYNDFSMAAEGKRKGVVNMLTKLKKAGVKVTGVGMQGHLGLDYPAVGDFEKSILAFSATGAQVMITEMDITVLPSPRYNMGADVNQVYAYKKEINPYSDGLPDTVETKLSSRYIDFFKLFLKHQDKISRVTLWGVTDGDSWKNNWPVPGRKDYPLWFDRQYKAKPFVQEIAEMALDGI